jgi:hypothetical protein
MNLDHYEYTVDRLLLDYEFTSSGPNGNIRKLISFVPRNEGGRTFFVLDFGDYSDAKGVDHLTVTDNKDTEKILATIAATVIEFTTSFPDMGVYAIGSTKARTRLYQMNIRKYWKDIEALLLVYGYTNGKWELFQEKVNYDAFFVRRKNVTLSQ